MLQSGELEVPDQIDADAVRIIYRAIEIHTVVSRVDAQVEHLAETDR